MLGLTMKIWQKQLVIGLAYSGKIWYIFVFYMSL